MTNLRDIVTNKGNDLDTLSRSSPVLLVFLREFECIFCKEAIRDLAQLRQSLLERNIKPVFVHMTSYDVADDYFFNQGLENVEHISNPECDIYEKFGLTKGSIGQLFGLKVWARGYGVVKTGIKLSRKKVGDSFQMPGVFMIYESKIEDSYIHKSAADRPDYERLLECCKAK